MKKIGMIVLTVALCAAMLVSCAAPAAAPSETPSASASAETPADAQTSSGATDYMAWTKTEWDAASDADKEAASIAVLAKSGEALLGADVSAEIEKAKTDEKVKAEMDQAAAQVRKSIDSFFEQMPTANIGQLVDAMEELIKQSDSQN